MDDRGHGSSYNVISIDDTPSPELQLALQSNCSTYILRNLADSLGGLSQSPKNAWFNNSSKLSSISLMFVGSHRH